MVHTGVNRAICNVCASVSKQLSHALPFFFPFFWGSARAGLCPCLVMPLLLLLLLLLLLPLLPPYMLAVFAGPPLVHATVQWRVPPEHLGP